MSIEREHERRRDLDDENPIILCPTCIFYVMVGLKFQCLARRLKAEEEQGLAYICEDYSREDKSPLPNYEFANADFALIEKKGDKENG